MKEHRGERKTVSPEPDGYREEERESRTVAKEI